MSRCSAATTTSSTGSRTSAPTLNNSILSLDFDGSGALTGQTTQVFPGQSGGTPLPLGAISDDYTVASDGSLSHRRRRERIRER